MTQPVSLKDSAMLVRLQISQLSGHKMDRMETEAVEIKHHTVRRAARVHKSLLPEAQSLKDLHKITGELRTYLYKNTLPWADGLQIIKSASYFDFTAGVRPLVDKWNRQVDTFISEYPALIKDAEKSLGTLFNIEDYPDAATMRDKFSIDVAFLPVPDAADWRIDVGEEHLAGLRDSVEKQVKASTDRAMREVWGRVTDVVKRAHERLSQPDAVFRNSLIENAEDLIAILPSLNIANDPKLDAVSKALKAALCRHNPGTLRKDPAVRAQAANDLAKIQSKMGAFFGAGV